MDLVCPADAVKFILFLLSCFFDTSLVVFMFSIVGVIIHSTFMN